MVAGHNNNNGTHPSYLIYENPADKINITYPSNWQKIEYPPGAMGYGVGHRIIANFLAPLSSSDNWRGSMTIQISSQSDVKNIIPQNATATITKLGDHRAFKLEYASNERMYLNSNLSKFNTINLKIMQVWTTMGDNTYLLTYSAEASKYQQYLPVIQRMLNSFKVS
jgi:serine/threonine-protein kinase